MAVNEWDDALETLEPAQAGPQNPFDAVVTRRLGEQQQRTAIALSQAAETQPDRAAEILRLSREMRVPAPVVERNYEQIKKRAASIELSDLPRRAPTLSDWIAQPENAAVAQDDIPQLEQLEKSLTFLQSIARGVDVAQGMFYGFVEASGELLKQGAPFLGSRRTVVDWAGKALINYGRPGRISEEAELQMGTRRREFAAIAGPWDLVQWAKETIGEQIPIMAPMLAGGIAGAGAGAVVGGPGGATVGGLIGAFFPGLVMGVGEVQGSIKAIDPNAEIPLAAFVGGSGVAALDTVLPGRIGARLVRTFGRETAEAVAKRALMAPVKPKYLRQGAGGMATEGLTEALQEAIGAVAAAQGTGTDVNFEELWRQMVEAGAAGALLGGATTVVETTAERRMLDVRAAQAEQNKAVFEQLAATAAASKLVARSPEKAEEFIGKATDESTVYLPVDTWTTYWQEKGADPAMVAAELTGNAQAYQQALEQNTDLAIPTAVYATRIAATEHHAFFSNEFRLNDPEVMNAREAKDYRATILQQAKAAETAETGAEPTATETVAASLIPQLEAAGYDQATAGKLGTFMAGVFGSVGGRTGFDPQAILGALNLRVQRPDVSVSLTRADGARPETQSGLGLENRDSQLDPARAERLPAEGGVRARIEPRGIDEVPAAYREHFDALLADARERGVGGTPEELAGQFLARLERAKPIALARREAMAEGPDARKLLEAIGRVGGINALLETGFAGEIDALQENLGGVFFRTNPRTKEKGPKQFTLEAKLPGIAGPIVTRRKPFTGEQRAFAKGKRDTKGRKIRVPEPGMALDTLREHLLEQGFEFEDLAEMIEAIFEAVAAYQQGDQGTALETDIANVMFNVMGMQAGEDWFEDTVFLQRPTPKIDDLQARRMGMPGELQAGLNLLSEEAAWMRAVTTPGALVRHDDGFVGVVIEGATDPVNGTGRDGMALIEHEFEGQQAQRWYRALQLEPAPEEQPALPGAEDVRAQEIATPEFDVPFALTSETAVRKGKQTTLFQGAWHGSKHLFERFSLHAIGTGEGVQAYGWGLYFAGRREVAEFYRRQLAGEAKILTVKGERVDGWGYYESHLRNIADSMQRGMTWAKAKLQALEDLKYRIAYETRYIEGIDTGEYRGPHIPKMRDTAATNISNLRDAIAKLEPLSESDVELKDPGRLYKVEIPDETDYLLWDRPMAEQPDKAKAALQLEVIKETEPSDSQWVVTLNGIAVNGFNTKTEAVAWTNSAPGSDIYQSLALTKGSRGASEFLASHGLAGIQYLEGSSRNRQTFNVIGYGEKMAGPFNSRRDAENYIARQKDRANLKIETVDSPGANFNYVIFDDGLVKVVEYFQGRQVEQDNYTLDLFGERPEDLAAASGAVAGGPVDDIAAMQRDDVEGKFSAPTRLVAEARKQLGVSAIVTPSDAATAAAYLAKGAQERLDGIVVDEMGTPLAIIGSFKGNVNSAHVHPSVVLAEAFRIRGAAEVWFVHNHPSGTETLSRDDKLLADRLEGLFQGSDIRVGGILAVGKGRFDYYRPSNKYTASGDVREAEPDGVTVPVLEREFVSREVLSDTLTPQTAITAAKVLGADQFGLMLLDTRQRAVGFVPMEPKLMIRGGGRLDALYRALSIGAPGGAIVYAPEPGQDVAALNLANALHAQGISVQDIIAPKVKRDTYATIGEGEGVVSWRERGLYEEGRLSGIFRQGARGALRISPDRKFTIELFENADLSTLLHESGHLFLEMMGDLVGEFAGVDAGALTPQQAKFIADYNAVLAWLGVSSREEIRVEHHEQFARGFEAYLMEGQAPSLELRSIFASFRAWLLGVYKTLTALNVELTPEVRGVFDRLVASDAAIAEAEAAPQVQPMFLTREQAGMTPEQFALYTEVVEDASRRTRETLDRQLLSEVQREQTAVWRRQHADTKAAVEREVFEMPVYRAIAAMRSGEHPDGSPLVEGLETPPLKLSKQMLVERYGAERLRRLPRPYVYAAEGGLDPDVVAEMFGFSSGDEMLEAVSTAAPMRDLVEAETRRRMLEEHGSLLLDGTIFERAKAATASEERETVVRAELRALRELQRTVAPFERRARTEERRERAYERRWLEAEANLREAIAVGRQQVVIDQLRREAAEADRARRAALGSMRASTPPAELLREMARERIAGLRIRDVRPTIFWTAGNRAAAQAIELATAGDYDAAIAAKQQQLLNLALYREATRTLEDIETRVRKARDLAKGPARARLGQAGSSYLDQVDGILARFEFARISDKVLDRRASLASWAAALEAEGIPVDLPEELLNEARRKNYRELSVEEFVGITDGLQQIAHLARFKNRLLKSEAQREFAVVRDKLAQSIRDNAGRQRPSTERDRRPTEEARRVRESILANHRKIASLARELDGFEDGGLVWEYIVRPLNEAGNREASMNADATRRFREIIEGAYPGRDKAALYEKQHIPAVGDSLSKMQRVVLALNWGNVEGRQRVLSYEKWSEEQVNAVLETLDATDWRFISETWAYLDSFWPEIEAKERRLTGLAPKKVEALPIMTRFGEMAGGYFPLKYDDRLSASAASKLDLEAANLAKQAAYVGATTKRGHTKERKARVLQPIRQDFGVIFEHVGQVIHDLTHHEALVDVGRLLADKEVSQAIIKVHGDIVYKSIKDTVRDVAFGDLPARNGVERGLNHLRVGMTVARLGWSITTAMLQPIGLTQSMVRIGPGWVARGVAQWLGDAVQMENTVGMIRGKSEFMRNRGRTQQREINEIRNTLGVDTGRYAGWMDDAMKAVTGGKVHKQSVADSFFFLIQSMQLVADVPTWLGAYEKAIAADNTEARAIALADQAVLDAQGGGQIKDMSAVQRGGPMMKIWTNFYSFFNTTVNLTIESTRRTKFAKPGQVGRLAVDYLLLYIVPASLGWMVRETLKGDGDDDEGWTEALVRENIAYLAGTLVGLREITGAVQGYYGYQGPAGAGAFAAAGRLVRQTEQVLEQGEEGLDEAFWKSLNDTAGILFHYPAGQVGRTLDGIAAIAEGRAENPGVLIAGAPREGQ